MEDAKDLGELKTELETLQTTKDIAETSAQIREIKQGAIQGTVVQEAWGDLVDRHEHLWDTPDFNNGYPSPSTTIDDRSDGKFVPVYENEMELAALRGAARILGTKYSPGISILESLDNYTISNGFTWEAASETIPEAAEIAQKVFKAFMDDNNWEADLEREVHRKSREDGEAPLVLRPQGWRTKAQILEPDQITEPADPTELEDYLAEVGMQTDSRVSHDFVPSWSFGVHTQLDDPSAPLGYHVAYDSSSGDWDYFPADDVPLAITLGTGVMELIKRNVPRSAKRGVTDFYPSFDHLPNAEDLLIKVEKGGAVQAAIALIRKHSSTVTGSQIAGMRSGSATDSYNKPMPGGGTRNTYRQRWEPGTIVDTRDSDYQYGPMGQSSAPNFIEIIQASLRATASRWHIPEYMISSDASNNNHASILVSGSPFVQSRQADQRFYASRFKNVAWSVLRIAYEGGRFAKLGLSWDEIEAQVEVNITAPDITIGDDFQQTQIREIEHRNGVLSRETWINESGRDVPEETAKLDKEAATRPPPLAAPPSLSESLIESVGGPARPFPQRTRDIIEQLKAETTEESSGSRAAVVAALENVESVEEGRAILQEQATQGAQS